MLTKKEFSDLVREDGRVTRDRNKALSTMARIFKEYPRMTIGRTTCEIWPDSTEHSRKIVGVLMTKTAIQPTFRKWSPTNIEASFAFGKFSVRVNGYRTLKCKEVTRTVTHAATPAQEAQPERTEVVTEIVCELPNGGTI